MSETDDEAKILKQLMGPMKLFLGPVIDVAVQIKKQVDAEQDSKVSVMRELRVLAAAVDRGEISEEEFEEREEILLDKLEAIEARENPDTSDAGTNELNINEPSTDEPSTDEPSTDEPDANEPDANESVTNESNTDGLDTSDEADA